MRDMMDVVQDLWRQARPDYDAEPMGVVGRISRASRLLEQGHREYLGELGLEEGEFDVLATIYRYGPPYVVAPGKLVETSIVKPPAMTNRVDRLVAKKLVTRETDPDDRRKVRITLTDKGRETIERHFPGRIANEDRMLEVLDADERAQLARLLRKLLVSLGDDAGRLRGED